MIFGDSMLKHIDTEKLSPNLRSENRIDPGSRVEHLIDYLRRLKDFPGPEDENVTDVIIHSGTNDLPEADSRALADQIGNALNLARKVYTNAVVHYSPIIPKYDNRNISQCDEINEIVERFCGFEGNNFNYLHTRGIFVKGGSIRWERLSKRDKLHLNRSGIVAMGKHLKYAIHTREGQQPPPYSR